MQTFTKDEGEEVHCKLYWQPVVSGGEEPLEGGRIDRVVVLLYLITVRKKNTKTN